MKTPNSTKALIKLYKTNQQFKELVRFCIVGTVCTVLDATIFNLVLLIAPYPVALVSGYCLCLMLNYYLTIHWTFEKHANVQNAVGIIGAHMFNLFVVRMGLMFVFVNLCGIDEQIAFIPTLIISVVTNFLIVRFVVNRTT